MNFRTRNEPKMRNTIFISKITKGYVNQNPKHPNESKSKIIGSWQPLWVEPGGEKGGSLSDSSVGPPGGEGYVGLYRYRYTGLPGGEGYTVGWVNFRFMSQIFSFSSISACVIEKICLDPLWDPFEYSWPWHTLAFGRWTDLQGEKPVQYC